MSDQGQLFDPAKTGTSYKPLSFLAEGAKRYAVQHGLEFHGPEPAGVRVNAADAFERARTVEGLPSMDESALSAFHHMREETSAQYDYLTKPRTAGGLGVNVEVTPHDPYDSPQAMRDDVAKNRRLQVMSTATTGGHLVFTDEENDKFRAVHDAFGHAAVGSTFSRDGEEQAYLAHAQMYSPQARPAMEAETRGQNAVLNYGSNPGSFGEQKVALIPAKPKPTDEPSPAANNINQQQFNLR